MPHIALLSSDTINKIAAGEVIERPASVVKELMENAVDAGAAAVTVEVKDGGLSFIRVTDNGSGIPREEVPLAFERHATSKITTELDLLSVTSLGFRGEALSSIASVARVEMITRRKEDLTGTRYVIEGGSASPAEDVGAPDGTTIIVNDLFFNTPARRKFMKTAITEGSYISSVAEKLALSHPEVSFRLILNGRICFHTSGNGKIKDIIYTIYGREASSELFEVSGNYENTTESHEGTEAAEILKVSGYAAKPAASRGNRSYEIFFVNGRYVKSPLLTKAIENAYSGFLMQHRYPFAVLFLEIDPALVDVNVHPAKRELRFRQEDMIYHCVYEAVRRAIKAEELIPVASPGKSTQPKQPEPPKTAKERPPEPFEYERRKAGHELSTIELLQQEFREGTGNSYGAILDRSGVAPAGISNDPDMDSAGVGRTSDARRDDGSGDADDTDIYRSLTAAAVSRDSGTGSTGNASKADASVAGIQRNTDGIDEIRHDAAADDTYDEGICRSQSAAEAGCASGTDNAGNESMQADISKTDISNSQLSFDDRLFTESSRREFVLIGQLFGTYWLIQYKDKFMLIDQHAAHEKVLFERQMAAVRNKDSFSQQIVPPIILTLNSREIEAVEKLMDKLMSIGYDIRPFGGREYAVYGVPYNLYSIAETDLLKEMIDGLVDEDASETGDLIYEKIALMSCKAAVKGNTKLSSQEAEALIDEMLKLDNPYACPHGRPTMIVMTKNEIEKKFKRVL